MPDPVREPGRTVKVLAMDRLVPRATPEQARPHFRAEAAHAWSLMKAGVTRENYLRADDQGVVSILECASVAQAREIMAGFPLARAGLIAFDFVELGAFTPLETLFAQTQTEVEAAQ